MRIRTSVVANLLLLLPVIVAAQQQRKIYLDPDESFSAYFSSALHKKRSRLP